MLYDDDVIYLDADGIEITEEEYDEDVRDHLRDRYADWGGPDESYWDGDVT